MLNEKQLGNLEVYMTKKTYPKHSLVFKGKSRTQQQFKQETDINLIMSRYEKTGVIDHLAKHQGSYGDFSNVEDYQTAVNKIMLADQMFLTLPATIRSQFDNDPAQFVEFAQNPDNLDTMRDLGLAPTLEVKDVQNNQTTEIQTKSTEQNDVHSDSKDT